MEGVALDGQDQRPDAEIDRRQAACHDGDGGEGEQGREPAAAAQEGQGRERPDLLCCQRRPLPDHTASSRR